ncbi:UBC-like protein [Glarea lozoyensis ATCC 20868]|uniref:UBC-like protein n=1 Tax=Glarea lozoyensis (strain ATCC 20868 / MF5171) TaxID=1116229 RepID=S3CX59_GLAL2|nr:UBC-like protein [Glarea lozoyensis ATCC 20868]EPE30932.1 UBC-like protein [Glarea lozoyensis ATCC 20868]
MTLTPGDPTLWSGVMFVRKGIFNLKRFGTMSLTSYPKGPYAPSILRFRISFPPSYPALPPLITFTTDIFHPLITPLTTYMYTTAFQDTGTVSATDEERLPPGGFSLRHGFPVWFGRASRKSAPAAPGINLQTPMNVLHSGEATNSTTNENSVTPSPSQASGDSRSSFDVQGKHPSTYDFLRYIRSTFDDDNVMDQIPLEAAGNPGAWQAWKTHRLSSRAGEKTSPESALRASASSGGAAAPVSPSKTPIFPVVRKPGEWNWDGVWEMRVKKGVEASITEAELFGTSSADNDLIRFLNLDEEQIETIQENIRRSVESLEPQRRGVV